MAKVKSQQEANFELMIGLLVAVPLDLGPSDSALPGLCRKVAQTLITGVTEGTEPAREYMETLTILELTFLTRSLEILPKLGYKPLDAAEEFRRMANDLDEEYGHVNQEVAA